LLQAQVLLLSYVTFFSKIETAAGLSGFVLANTIIGSTPVSTPLIQYRDLATFREARG
jgi:hypothetical protein